MKHVVSVCSRPRRGTTQGSRPAKPASRRPRCPATRSTSFVVLGEAERPADGVLWSDVSDEQHHAMMRAWFALLRFAGSGCPIVSLDPETARGFAASPPPAEAAVLEWPLRMAYGLSIGDGAVLVLHSFAPKAMPDHLRRHFKIVDGVIPIEAWGR